MCMTITHLTIININYKIPRFKPDKNKKKV